MKTKVLLVVAALAAGGTAHAEDMQIEHEQYTLDNGLQVILHHDDSLPIAHVEVWYHVGSKDEAPGRSGFAHLFEHLMFNGSKHWDDEYFAPLQAYGARINGTTNTERTNYFETVPSNVLERALWLEADRMGFLLEAMTQAKLDEQRDVVKNERRQNYEIRPYAKSRRAISEAVWPKGHPYHHLTIGSHEDLSAATLEDVKGFFRTWYVPNNATLTIAGSFDAEETRGWIQRYFGPIPKGPQPSPVRSAEAPMPEARSIALTDDVQLPRLYLVWRSPAFFAEGDAELDVLSSILTTGKTSRLYKRLVFDDRIAKDVSAYQASAELGSTYNIVATAAPGRTVEELEAAIDEELARFLAEGPTEVEVTRTVNAWRKGFFQRLEGVSGRAGLLQSYNHYKGDPGWVQKDLDRYLAVTGDSVVAWTRKVLVPEHRIRVVVSPGPKDVDAPPADGGKGGAR